MKCINYAHRGFSGKYPENTMLAFEKAIEAGCEGIELDVHLTKDGEMVIIHDEEIDRTSSKTGWIKDMTYEELSKIDFSYHFDVPFQKMPTLQEYFELVKDLNIITNIELKTGVYDYPGIEEKVYNLICEFHLQKKVVISSFNHFSVMRMKQLDETLICGFLTECWMIGAAEYVEKYQIEGYHPYFSSLSKKEMKEFKNRGISINTWTVNEINDIGYMIDLEVEGIISNYPDRVRDCLKERGLR